MNTAQFSPKIVIMGHEETGKTRWSRIGRGQEFGRDHTGYEPTIGANVMPCSVSNRTVSIWEIGGNPKFSGGSLAKGYLIHADGVIMFPDPTGYWKNMLNEYQNELEQKIPVVDYVFDVDGDTMAPLRTLLEGIP